MTARDGSVATQQQQPTATDSPVPHESQLKQIRDVSVNKTIPGGLFIACKSLHDKNIFDNFMTFFARQSSVAIIILSWWSTASLSTTSSVKLRSCRRLLLRLMTIH